MCKPISRCNFCEPIYRLILIAVIILLIIILLTVIFHFILRYSKIKKDKNDANLRKEKSLSYLLNKAEEKRITIIVNNSDGKKVNEYEITVKP